MSVCNDPFNLCIPFSEINEFLLLVKKKKKLHSIVSRTKTKNKKTVSPLEAAIHVKNNGPWSLATLSNGVMFDQHRSAS